MTTDLHACVERSQAAERAGDAADALEWHQAVPMFQRGRHRGVLNTLVALGDDPPPWVWARWIVYQVTRCEDSATGDRQRVALKYALESVHADQLADCHANGGDPIKVMARVSSESWFFHQLFVHDFDGLASFLDDFPVGRLAEHVDFTRTWVGRPLGGYQVGASLPGGRLRVYAAASASWVEVLDLGARSSAGDEGWVLGRLVPSGIDDLLMFDVPPLAVAERIAREVSEAGERPWAPITAALAEGRLAQSEFMREDYELATDVQDLDLLRLGTAARDHKRVLAQLREGRDEVGRAAYRILQRALDGNLPQRDVALLGAAALNLHADTEARGQLLRDGQADTWSRWASLVPEPARGRLLEFAEVSRAVA